MNAKKAKQLRKICRVNSDTKTQYQPYSPPEYKFLPENFSWVKIKKGLPRRLRTGTPRFFYQMLKG